MAKPLINILIPNWNTADLIIDGILPALRNEAGRSISITICDDASTENDFDTLQQQAHCPITLLKNNRRLGFTKTANRLLSTATHQIALLLNSDVIIPHIAPIFQMASILDQHHGLAIVGSADGPLFMDIHANPYTIPLMKGDPSPCPADYISASVMMLTTQASKLTNNFDLSYSPCYYEDSDFCFRLRSHGYHTLFTPTPIRHLQNQAHLLLEIEEGNAPAHTPFHHHINAHRDTFLSRWAPLLHHKTDNIITAIANYYNTQTQLKGMNSS